MSEKRFYITDTGLGLDTVSDEMYSFCDEKDFCRLFDKLNEQQVIIQELERKLKKYEKIGEEQLKQIIELQDEINDCEKFRYTVFKRIGELVE